MTEWFQLPRRDFTTDSPPWHEVRERSGWGGIARALCGASSYTSNRIRGASFAREPEGKVCAKCEREAKRVAVIGSAPGSNDS